MRKQTFQKAIPARSYKKISAAIQFPPWPGVLAFERAVHSWPLTANFSAIDWWKGNYKIIWDYHGPHVLSRTRGASYYCKLVGIDSWATLPGSSPKCLWPIRPPHHPVCHFYKLQAAPFTSTLSLSLSLSNRGPNKRLYTIWIWRPLRRSEIHRFQRAISPAIETGPEPARRWDTGEGSGPWWTKPLRWRRGPAHDWHDSRLDFWWCWWIYDLPPMVLRIWFISVLYPSSPSNIWYHWIQTAHHFFTSLFSPHPKLLNMDALVQGVQSEAERVEPHDPKWWETVSEMGIFHVIFHVVLWQRIYI